MAPITSVVIAAAELAAVAACSYLCVITLAKLRQARDLEFNRYWSSRLVLVCTSLLWVVSLTLQSPALFSGGGIAPISAAVCSPICVATHVLSEGFAEPMTLLIPLLTFRMANKAVGNPIPPETNRKIVLNALLITLPLAVIHIALLLVGIVLPPSSLNIHKLFSSVEMQEPACVLPLASTFVQAVVVVVLLVLLNLNSVRYARIVINRRLIRRLHMTQATLTVLLPVALIARVGSAVATGWLPASLFLPFSAFFHIYYFLTVGVAAYLVSSVCLQPVRAAMECPLQKLSAYTEVHEPAAAEDIELGAVEPEPTPDASMVVDLADLTVSLDDTREIRLGEWDEEEEEEKKKAEEEKPRSASDLSSLHFSVGDDEPPPQPPAHQDDDDDGMSSFGSASVASEEDPPAPPNVADGATPSNPRHRAYHHAGDPVMPRPTPFVRRVDRAVERHGDEEFPEI